jgi:hypothetical protein
MVCIINSLVCWWQNSIYRAWFQNGTKSKILATFEQLSGIKINFHKSELFCFGKAQDEASQYADLFGYGQGWFSIRYLEIPILYRRLTIAKWKEVEERLQNRLSSWKGKLLSLRWKIDTHKFSTNKYGTIYDIILFIAKRCFTKAWLLSVQILLARG